ncbi:A24 family peptidase [Bdellovibrionota bacterium FG-2]
MSGQTEYFVPLICVFGAIATFMDLRWGRIFNAYTVPLWFSGLIISAVIGGWGGFGDALAGSGIALLLYGLLFALGVMGGGDVKFLMALGAWGGKHYIVEVALLGILVGGILGVGQLMFKRRLKDFALRLYRFLLTVLVKELEFELPKVDQKITMPFGVPIAIAAVWVAWLHPFERWGIRLWF